MGDEYGCLGMPRPRDFLTAIGLGPRHIWKGISIY